ncbi:glycosyltransferase [Actinacidiphila acididurans]|uniref:dolichyl-phosphate beta-glucosyltransferase n=1 Tax=Actinacidiphila acididurans TaxID=2784346 RepID=A0ABS2TRV9_9ACTN|nr:glycosyltransferase [Actinacidiphila acididurans]MBM9505812.1 glycosyltransferase [Actinacidiphila acididurans]
MRTNFGDLPARQHLPVTAAAPAPPAGAPVPPVLDVVVPVHNEEKDLEPCVRRLHAHLSGTFPYPFRITIADNASTDLTSAVAKALAAELPQVMSFRLEQKGRGRALRTVWTASEAPVLAYMDVDLSTDLNALLPLVAPLISGHSDLAIGSRLTRSSRVVRGAKREFVSRAYNLILRGSLAARFSDAQCGFKAIRGDVAQRLLPMVEDTGWFFDTEMLVLAERAGLRIHEVPVDWVDDPDSSVDIVRTAAADLKGVWRVGRALATGRLALDRLRRPFGDDPRDRDLPGVPAGLARQLLGFCVIGALSTLFYLALYALFRTGTGAQAANALALLLSAFANTAANRRLTFGVRGRGGAVRHQAQGLVVFAIGLALTSGSLAALHTATAHPSHGTELAVLLAANLAATVLRFLLFRAWLFPDGAGAPAAVRPDGVVPAAAGAPASAAGSASGPAPGAVTGPVAGRGGAQRSGPVSPRGGRSAPVPGLPDVPDVPDDSRSSR